MAQPRPEGQEWEITQEWLDWVRQRMEERELSQRALAARLVESGTQATGASISDLMTGKSRRSKLVAAINAELGGTPPVQKLLDSETAIDETKARIDAKYRLLNEEERKLILQAMEVLAKGR